MTITTITPQSREAWLAGRGVGFYTDMTAAKYHADPCPAPSLSSSIAKVLVNETPRHAWFAHPRLNPRLERGDESKFDLGSVVHEFLLGKGGGYEVLAFDNWTTKAAKEARDEVRDSGKTPILSKDFDRVATMAGVANARLEAMGIDILANQNESVIIWQERDAWCRAMIDSLGKDGVVYDLKTTGVDLSDNSLMRQIINIGYDISAAFYLRGLQSVFPEIEGRLRWRWIWIETSPPHEVRVTEASGMTLEIGARKADFAIRKWQHCMATDKWPGYATKVETIDLPPWAESQWLEREMGEALTYRA